MLVLSRKSMESIRISDDITVTVLSVQGNKVRLGVQAPRTIPVHRTEVYEAISGPHSGPPACSPQLPATLTPARSAELKGDTQLLAGTKKEPAGSVKPWERICPTCKKLQHVRNKVCGCGHMFAARAGPLVSEGEPL